MDGRNKSHSDHKVGNPPFNDSSLRCVVWYCIEWRIADFMIRVVLHSMFSWGREWLFFIPIFHTPRPRSFVFTDSVGLMFRSVSLYMSQPMTSSVLHVFLKSGFYFFHPRLRFFISVFVHDSNKCKILHSAMLI